jgi:hypothetical protein
LGVRLIHGTLVFGSQLCGSVPVFCNVNVNVALCPFTTVVESKEGLA